MKPLRVICLTGFAMCVTSNLSSSAMLQTDPPKVALTTIAFRVHRMAEMIAFYSEAFGARFREVDTYGLKSQFGELPGLTLKFVPIRDSAEFGEFPIHQPGFEVPDVGRVVAAALRLGGRLQNEAKSEGGRIVAAVRDPDGNTIELYQR